MKGASTTFVHWIVFCPRWNQWETFTKLGFDEVVEERVLPWSPLWSLGAWAAPQRDPGPWRWFIIYCGHKHTDEEGIPMAAAFPAPLASGETVSLEHASAPGGRRSKYSTLLDTRPPIPLHRALTFRASITKGVGDIPMELAVPSSFFLLKR